MVNDMDTFSINEIFTSIQGEGYFSGTPAHFIRFSGCPVQCHFCDTRDTWKHPGKVMSWDALCTRILSMKMAYPKVSHVVLTGGEPLWRNPGLANLLHWLMHDQCMGVQIETSGTEYDGSCLNDMVYFRQDEKFFLTISPKAPKEDMEEYLPVDPYLLQLVDEIKFAVTGAIDLDKRIPSFLVQQKVADTCEGVTMLWLSPVDFKDEARNKEIQQMCAQYCLVHGWSLTCQMHKFFGLR